MVAFTILLITTLPLTYLLTSAVSSAADARQRQAALQLADSWLEVLSNSSVPAVNGSPITNQPTNPLTLLGTNAANTPIPKSTLAGTNFTVSANFTLQSVNNRGQSDLCSSGQPPSPSHPGVILLQVTVSWNQGNSSVTDSTALNYPQPGLQTQGFLAVQLTNDTGTNDVWGNSSADRMQAIPVNITETAQQNSTDPWVASNSTHTLTLYPDDNGCVFAQVPTGTYTVTAGQPTAGQPASNPAFGGYGGTPPFVTNSGSTTDSVTLQPVTVTAETFISLNPFDEGIKSAVTYAGAAAVDGGVSCPGTAALTCVTTGNGTSGASAAWGGTGANWNATTISGISNLNAVACTSSNAPTCVGVGNNGGTAVILTTASDLGTTTTDSPPAGVTSLSQVACPSADGCYALGTTATGPVLLAGLVGQNPSSNDRWAVVAPASTRFTGLSSLACPLTSTCEVSGTAVVGTAGATPVILRLDGDPATLTPTFTTDTLPAVVESVGTITCPTTTLCESLAIGDSASPFDATVLTSTIIASGANTWTNEPNFAAGAVSMTGLSCTSSTCVAIGTKPGTVAPSTPPTPVVWTADLTQSPHDWSASSNFPSVAAVSSVACGQPSGTDTADCVVTAATGLGTGQLITGSLNNGSWTWNSITTVSGVTPRYYVDVSCESPSSASQSVCAAVGATAAGGPMIVTSANGPLGSWSTQTPSSLPGALVNGVPLEIAPASTNNWSVPVAWSSTGTNATSLPNVLYPQPGGYSIAAGDCQASPVPWGTSVASINALPGGQTSATVPLALLPLQVTTAAGAPMSGATVTLTPTCSGVGSTDRYTMPATDAYGLTRTSVPYGVYTYTVTSATGVTTSPNSSPPAGVSLSLTTSNSVAKTVTTVSGTPPTANPPVTTTYYLPGPVVVTAS